ncbi:hypothetical protein [Kutzneria sp. NPDC051319]|uniref:hypothetical protein n=1 Tax=Kutzneria sp. NPDC051319 TaxID=3155047 RepID=UPI0034433FB1
MNETKAPHAAAIWSLLYAVAGLCWALGVGGFPFGEGDPDGRFTWFAGLRPQPGGWVIAATGLACTATALAMTRRQPRLHLPLLVFGCCAAALLLIIVPDVRVLTTVAHAPIFLVGGMFGWQEAWTDLAASFAAPVLNQSVCVLGGALWLTATLNFARRASDSCVHCGRGAGWDRQATLGTAVYVGRLATWIAVIAPLPYAVSRWSWALGIPLGVSDDFLRWMRESGADIGGAVLATMAVGGSLLTLGLVQRWGEVFPRWILGLAGRRVPPMLAVVPALAAAVLLASGGITMVHVSAAEIGTGDGGLGQFFPAFTWPVWGAALAVATVAYHYRRHGACRHCHRA